jgi:hypothetical protein
MRIQKPVEQPGMKLGDDAQVLAKASHRIGGRWGFDFQSMGWS